LIKEKNDLTQKKVTVSPTPRGQPDPDNKRQKTNRLMPVVDHVHTGRGWESGAGPSEKRPLANAKKKREKQNGITTNMGPVQGKKREK